MYSHFPLYCKTLREGMGQLPHLVLCNVRVADRCSNELCHLEAGNLSSKQLVPRGQPHIVGSLVGVSGPLHASWPDYDVGDPAGLQGLFCLLLEEQDTPEQVQNTCKLVQNSTECYKIVQNSTDVRQCRR